MGDTWIRLYYCLTRQEGEQTVYSEEFTGLQAHQYCLTTPCTGPPPACGSAEAEWTRLGGGP